MSLGLLQHLFRYVQTDNWYLSDFLFRACGFTDNPLYPRAIHYQPPHQRRPNFLVSRHHVSFGCDGIATAVCSIFGVD